MGYISLPSMAQSTSPGLVYGEQKAFPDGDIDDGKSMQRRSTKM